VIARFYEHESCGQCSQCREGTQWLSQIFRRIAHGRGQPDDVDTLEALAKGMAPGKTICALSDAAAIPTLSAVKLFKDELIACIREQRDPLASPARAYASVGAH
jgi:NADH-quinone oxidoreductase subunit F